MKRICVLDNDQLDVSMIEKYQSYSAMLIKLLKSNGCMFEFIPFKAMSGEYPKHFDEFDAVILSGSRHDSFGAEPWVKKLRNCLDNALADDSKLLGICFGHQLLALCLGAKVGRAENGWGLGCQTYQWLPAADEYPAMQGTQEIKLFASHQDQVQTLPQGSVLMATSAYCPIAAYRYKNQVFGVQPHPEFDAFYAKYVIEKNKNKLSPLEYLNDIESINQHSDGDLMAKVMLEFINKI